MRAAMTVTFVGLKLGFYVGAGPNFVGELKFDDLGIADDKTGAVAQRITETWVRTVLGPRPRTAHKGSNGRVLIVGGNTNMAGAVRLAGEAALRVGAGLVHIATRPENVGAIVAGRPELIVHGVSSGAELRPVMDRWQAHHWQ